MENKIVYLKTYIITIVVMLILFVAGLGGLAYYYEQKIDYIKDNKPNITIVDTNVDNVKVK